MNFFDFYAFYFILLMSSRVNGCCIGGYCYTFFETEMTWENASRYCASENMELAIINTERTQHFLTEKLEEGGWSDGWVGGRKYNTDWRWVNGNVTIQNQGCYRDSVPRDLPYQIRLNNVTPEKCIRECRMANFTYAGLQDGTTCWCGDTYNTYGIHPQCTANDNIACCNIPCSGDPSKTCGQSGANHVYKTRGLSYSNWYQKEPRDLTGGRSCGAMNKGAGYLHYQWSTEICTRSHGYICELYITEQECNAIPRSLYFERSCYTMDEKDRKLPWFSAREVCLQSRGDLVTIDNAREQEALKTWLSGSRLRGVSLWIGLTNRHWAWRKDIEVGYYQNWATDEPNPTNECLSFNRLRNNKWFGMDCNANKFFICQTADNSTMPSTQPVMASKEKMRRIGFVVGLVIAGLLLLIIPVMLVGICITKKRKENSEIPMTGFEIKEESKRNVEAPKLERNSSTIRSLWDRTLKMSPRKYKDNGRPKQEAVATISGNNSTITSGASSTQGSTEEIINDNPSTYTPTDRYMRSRSRNKPKQEYTNERQEYENPSFAPELGPDALEALYAELNKKVKAKSQVARSVSYKYATDKDNKKAAVCKSDETAVQEGIYSVSNKRLRKNDNRNNLNVQEGRIELYDYSL